ncbi:TolC family outer membrane protein [Sphingopyxis alaskensis]|jgi:outer membrane protein|uniref:Type I secretion outer membrane protein, TolC n=1 Tax=Sphingopyxis alaskensis (strain DSM 13593 / LMG 18877 / RB2256) TaxID=317655 RepID=Q1GQV1_SPHAL|nr:TolC family outer membrane protein [Sphingopyxis alaskensis]ABF53971.1 Type I secretion outer membrane protein, TolC [Sphingopyxis alaskensis RB2256]MCM3418955.1 TolC family outer membrane protein [Sphingopyxis alaskensis]
MTDSDKKPCPRRARWLAGLAASALMLPMAAEAETLQGALAKAYENNPTLTGARAGQRAADENVPIEKSRGLPEVGTQASYEENLIIPGNAFNSPARSLTAGARLTVPIYQGGAVRNAVRAAKYRVEAGQANLRATEASIFSQVVGAYMDVIRDQAIVQLNQKNVAVLRTNLQATSDRFEIGDLTRTDVAQSEARLALAEGDLRTAEANLIASREAYIRLVGEAPVDLEPPPPLPNLPATAEEAVAIALDNNPDIEAADQQVKASRADIGTAKSSRAPRVSAILSGGYNNFLGSLNSGVPGVSVTQETSSAAAGVEVTLPIFTAGRRSAQVRQAQSRSSQAIEQYVEVERGVIAQTRGAYAAWQANERIIAATRQAVGANALSLEGVRAENSVGTRSILDILNAEQEYLNTQVQLVSAQRNSYVAAFSLLAAMGKAEARDLGIEGGALYDPEVNYRRVKGQLWDWADDPAPQQVATDTRAVPPADAAIPEGPPAPTPQ